VSFTALLFSFLPALPLALCFVCRDREMCLSELFWTAVGVGLIAIAPIAFVERLVAPLAGVPHDPEASAALQGFAVAALPEEGGKLLILWLVVLRHADFRRPRDALPLGFAVALGFAITENIFYVAGATDWTLVALTRALTAVPTHAALGVVMGYFVALALLDRPRRKLHGVLAFAVPFLLHGLYDYAAIASGLTDASGWSPWSGDGLLCLVLAVEGIGALLAQHRFYFARADLAHGSMPMFGAGVSMAVGFAIAACAVALLFNADFVIGEWLAARGEVATPVQLLAASIMPLLLGLAILLDGWQRSRLPPMRPTDRMPDR
jgi:hypothetical protein